MSLNQALIAQTEVLMARQKLLSKQLAHRFELVTLLLQVANDRWQRRHGGRLNVMHQNNATRARRRFDAGNNHLSVARLPVLRVNVPLNGWQLDLRRIGLRNCPVWRPQKRRQTIKGGIVCINIFALSFIKRRGWRKPWQIRMVVSMGADLVALIRHLPSQLRIMGDASTDHEKGRFSLVLAQNLQDLRRGARIWPIIKGQRNHLASGGLGLTVFEIRLYCSQRQGYFGLASGILNCQVMITDHEIRGSQLA